MENGFKSDYNSTQMNRLHSDSILCQKCIENCPLQVQAAFDHWTETSWGQTRLWSICCIQSSCCCVIQTRWRCYQCKIAFIELLNRSKSRKILLNWLHSLVCNKWFCAFKYYYKMLNQAAACLDQSHYRQILCQRRRRALLIKWCHMCIKSLSEPEDRLWS